MGQPQPRAPGTSLGMGPGWAKAWACGWAWLSGTHGQAGQGCGELQAGPAAASLGQGLVAPGAEMGPWAVGRWWSLRGAGQGQSGLLVPSGPGDKLVTTLMTTLVTNLVTTNVASSTSPGFELELNNPSSLSRSSQDLCSRPFTSFIALLWTRSSTSMSFLYDLSNVTEFNFVDNSKPRTNAVFHLGLNNPVKQHGLRTDRPGGSFAEKELEVLVADRSNMSGNAGPPHTGLNPSWRTAKRNTNTLEHVWGQTARTLRGWCT
ncbi:hypothetical protein QYF61_018618 [Mycteria americana]|uniref:Uncharacterized protein n=1 Tax=Mycteria americana TaxID=33587 RepID=A0AAN7Q5D4_MYCAM|nr:hypothetical protein QYF61_018618 [Mycteria americana]